MRTGIAGRLAVCLLVSMGFVAGRRSLQAQESTLPFYFGVDLSYVNEMDDCGAVYRENGEQRDAFALFAERGANLVRARLWHNPDWTAYSTLADVKRTLARAQAAGMQTLLDMHYSDNWADPGRQEAPAAWAEITDTQELTQAVYDYTSVVLTELHAAGLTPTFVQVGNEINSGLIKTGKVALDWPRDARLLNSGIQAVRDFAATTGSDIRIILHVAQPENTGWWFTQAEEAGVTDFDVIGLSYYPQWSSFSIGDVGLQVQYLRQRFGKDVMIVETAYGWTREAVDETASNILNQGTPGYPFSPDGQRRFMMDLTQTLISNGGSGVVYWEPAWVSTRCTTRWGQGSHWENATFFDFQHENEVLEGISFLNPAAYWYPSRLSDGIIEPDYGDPLSVDADSDVLGDITSLDLLSLYGAADDTSLTIATTLAGDVFSADGSFLYYIDTTHDAQGATVDVGKRPITAADPFKPEFRLDVSIRNGQGSVQFNAWLDDAWETRTFTGSIAILAGEPSVVEVQFLRSELGQAAQINVAVVSTDRPRAHTAADLLGTSFTPSDWSEPVVVETFFTVPVTGGSE